MYLLFCLSVFAVSLPQRFRIFREPVSMTILLVFMIHQVNGCKTVGLLKAGLLYLQENHSCSQACMNFFISCSIQVYLHQADVLSAYLFSCCCIHIASIFYALQIRRFVASWFYVEMQNCCFNNNSGSSDYLRQCISYMTLSSFFLQSNIDKTLKSCGTQMCLCGGEVKDLINRVLQWW